MTAPDRDPRAQLRAYLHALADGALAGSFFEVRERHGQLMRRRFYPTQFPDRAVSAILRAGRERDVYLGAAPRARTQGGRAAIAWLSALWVDADIPEAIERLQAFTPAPAIVVASGRGQHAYWLLARPADVDSGEHANRRLAHHLAADVSCTDAARILRPPHTTNFRHQPARPVRLLRLAPQERHPLDRITGGLPAPPRRTVASGAARSGRAARPAAADALLELDPAVYVSALLGIPVGRDGKVRCPFHADQHPSLHVYPTAARGWHCFSCRRGGTVYDLAAALWLSGQSEGAGARPLRGASFLAVRERLLAVFFGEGKAA
jgi:CHC2-type zinc finger protein